MEHSEPQSGPRPDTEMIHLIIECYLLCIIIAALQELKPLMTPAMEKEARSVEKGATLTSHRSRALNLLTGDMRVYGEWIKSKTCSIYDKVNI